MDVGRRDDAGLLGEDAERGCKRQHCGDAEKSGFHDPAFHVAHK
jgi:hypothetical protein